MLRLHFASLRWIFIFGSFQHCALLFNMKFQFFSMRMMHFIIGYRIYIHMHVEGCNMSEEKTTTTTASEEEKNTKQYQT